MKLVNEIADRILLTGIYMAYIGGLSYLGSRLLDTTYSEMLLPTLLGVIVIEMVNNRMKFKNVKCVRVDLSGLEKKFDDQLQFKVNSLDIQESLNNIYTRQVNMDVIEHKYKIQQLEREIEKLKESK